MKRWGNGSVLIAGALIGVLFMAVPRTQAEPTESQGPPAVGRAVELSGEVTKLEAEKEALQTRLNEANRRIQEYEDSMRDTGEMTEQFSKTLENARIEAGLVALSGEGVVVTVDNLVIPATGQVVKYVQDEDLLLLINELNAAGAEAIAINGERVVATTEVRSAGSFININTRAHAAPFTVLAIGNPRTLDAAMHLYGGVLDNLSQIARVQAEMAENVEIPAYQGVVVYEYAKVVT